MLAASMPVSALTGINTPHNLILKAVGPFWLALPNELMSTIQLPTTVSPVRQRSQL